MPGMVLASRKIDAERCSRFSQQARLKALAGAHMN